VRCEFELFSGREGQRVFAVTIAVGLTFVDPILGMSAAFIPTAIATTAATKIGVTAVIITLIATVPRYRHFYTRPPSLSVTSHVFGYITCAFVLTRTVTLL
jgi:hypothetical protein